MTLGGLALAIGILVDEAAVSIENIHSHLQRGASIARAVRDGSTETVLPDYWRCYAYSLCLFRRRLCKAQPERCLCLSRWP